MEIEYLEECGVMRVPCKPKYVVTLEVVRRDGWCKFDTVLDEQTEFNDKQSAISHLKRRLSEMMGVDCVAIKANVREWYNTIIGEQFDYVFNIDNATLKDEQLWN